MDKRRNCVDFCFFHEITNPQICCTIFRFLSTSRRQWGPVGETRSVTTTKIVFTLQVIVYTTGSCIGAVFGIAFLRIQCHAFTFTVLSKGTFCTATRLFFKHTSLHECDSCGTLGSVSESCTRMEVLTKTGHSDQKPTFTMRLVYLRSLQRFVKCS